MAGAEEEAPSIYSRQVGERLRVIRKQKRLSLQEVEAQSNQEFKASVLGAYERGERALSVPRLDRLSQFYSVPVEQLLPREVTGTQAAAALQSETNKKLAIDVSKLMQLSGSPFEMLARYLRLIQVQRKPGKPQRQAAPRKAKEPGAFLRWLQKLLIRLGLYRQAAVLASSGQEGYRIQTTVRAMQRELQ